jgi:hypothetical protein
VPVDHRYVPTVAWSVVEQFVEGKTRERACEDVIVTVSGFAAVVDGATDETGGRFDGLSGGRFAADVVATALRALDPESTAREFADALTGRLRDAVVEVAGELDDASRWPSASVVCFSVAREQIWRIGDCSFLLDGRPNIGTKRVDDAAYGFRAAVNAARVAAGTPLEEILRDDPGARCTRPLFDLQQHLSNREGPWGYGCVNGRPVPDCFVEVFDLERSTTDVVMTSDGYPVPRATLAASEADLRRLLSTDPAAIGEAWAVGKALRPGATSFDDRAYLRLTRQLSRPVPGRLAVAPFG